VDAPNIFAAERCDADHEGVHGDASPPESDANPTENIFADDAGHIGDVELVEPTDPPGAAADAASPDLAAPDLDVPQRAGGRARRALATRPRLRARTQGAVHRRAPRVAAISALAIGAGILSIIGVGQHDEPRHAARVPPPTVDREPATAPKSRRAPGPRRQGRQAPRRSRRSLNRPADHTRPSKSEPARRERPSRPAQPAPPPVPAPAPVAEVPPPVADAPPPAAAPVAPPVVPATQAVPAPVPAGALPEFP